MKSDFRTGKTTGSYDAGKRSMSVPRQPSPSWGAGRRLAVPTSAGLQVDPTGAQTIFYCVGSKSNLFLWHCLVRILSLPVHELKKVTRKQLKVVFDRTLV